MANIMFDEKWLDSLHCTYIGYTINEIIKKEERIEFAETARAESFEFLD